MNQINTETNLTNENRNTINAPDAYFMTFGPDARTVVSSIPQKQIITTAYTTNVINNNNNISSNVNNHMPIRINNYPNTNINQSIKTNQFKGRQDCTKCNGNGYVLDNKGKKLKPCKKCVMETGNCNVCTNTGYDIKTGKKCKCLHAKQL